MKKEYFKSLPKHKDLKLAAYDSYIKLIKASF